MSLSNKSKITKQSLKFDILLTKINYYHKTVKNIKEFDNIKDPNKELYSQIASKYKTYLNDTITNGYSNLHHSENSQFYSVMQNYINGYKQYNEIMTFIKNYDDEKLLLLYEELIIDDVF